MVWKFHVRGLNSGTLIHSLLNLCNHFRFLSYYHLCLLSMFDQNEPNVPPNTLHFNNKKICLLVVLAESDKSNYQETLQKLWNIIWNDILAVASQIFGVSNWDHGCLMIIKFLGSLIVTWNWKGDIGATINLYLNNIVQTVIHSLNLIAHLSVMTVNTQFRIFVAELRRASIAHFTTAKFAQTCYQHSVLKFRHYRGVGYKNKWLNEIIYEYQPHRRIKVTSMHSKSARLLYFSAYISHLKFHSKKGSAYYVPSNTMTFI